MPSSPTTCSPAGATRIPRGLAREVLERTGVTLSFYRPDGVAAAEEGAEGAATAEPPPGLVLEAARQNAERLAVCPGEVRMAWPIRVRARAVLVGLASAPVSGAGDVACARRLLAAVADLAGARVVAAAADEELDDMTETLTQCFEEVGLLHNLGEVLRINRPVPQVLEFVCSQLRETTGAEAAAAYLPGRPGAKAQTVVVGRLPLLVSDLPALLQHVLGGPAPETAILINNHAQDDPAIARLSMALERLVVVPLALGEAGTGALAAMNRREGEFGSPEAKLIRSSASASAVLIENRRLYDELQEMMLDLTRALVSSVDAKDPYTCGHSTRVALTCREVARGLDFSEEQAEQAYMAGLLHDVGKIGTPEAILRKVGRLLPEERQVMRRHPEVGGCILGGIRKLEPIREAVIHHHERFDGTGYPDGLAGEAIPLLARIVGLADAFDAMTSHRPYRPALALDHVKLELSRGSGVQFDPRVVSAFFALDLAGLMHRFADPAAGATARAP